MCDPRSLVEKIKRVVVEFPGLGRSQGLGT